MIAPSWRVIAPTGMAFVELETRAVRVIGQPAVPVGAALFQVMAVGVGLIVNVAGWEAMI